MGGLALFLGLRIRVDFTRASIDNPDPSEFLPDKIHYLLYSCDIKVNIIDILILYYNLGQ